MSNIYFELTKEFNRDGTIAILSSGQAVVHYRLAIMSKDGDWILRETPEACRTVMSVLDAHGARYRPGAPLDPRWLRYGWSSHFQFVDEQGRRIRCDFVSRAPRVQPAAVDDAFRVERDADELPVIDLISLITTKRTKRAKDYAVIAELARLLPPLQELQYTTDPDRILELTPTHGQDIDRESVRLAAKGAARIDVVVALARETDAFQQKDKRRLVDYERASESFLRRFRAERIGDIALPEAHERLVALAEGSLPEDPNAPTQ